MKPPGVSFAAVAAWLAAIPVIGCGYRVVGHADLLPHDLHTIAIPAFNNATTRYKLTEQLPQAITRAFLSRTRYEIVPDVNSADAVLRGSILSYDSYPTIYDRETGRASAVQVEVLLDLTLRERATGKVLFSREKMQFRERYEISVNPQAYFEESDPALDRLSRDVAQTVVSAILEGF